MADVVVGSSSVKAESTPIVDDSTSHSSSSSASSQASSSAASTSSDAAVASESKQPQDEILLDPSATDAPAPFSTPSIASSSLPPAASNAPLEPSVFETTLKRLSDNSLVELLEGLETLLVYTKNLILYPDEKKYRKIKITNIHYQERLGHLSGAEEAMNAIGYVPQGEYLRLDENRIHASGNEQLLLKMEKQIVLKLNQLKKEWASMPARTEPSHSFKSVHSVGCHSAIGKRHSMEDDEIMVDEFCGEPTQGFFGLYDGHGGRATVDFVVKSLHMNLEQHLKRHPESDLPAAFKHSYLTTDGQLRRQSILRSGSTSVTCVVRQREGKKKLYIANVGDSRAILCRNKQAVRLTIDHKASLPEEAKRIREAGGFIGRNKRVNGVLAISRALGDHMLKNAGGGLNDVVSAEPYCEETELTNDDTYILMACDGVWDVLQDQEAIDFMLTKLAFYEEQVKEQKKAGINPSTAPSDASQSTEPVSSSSSASSSSQTLTQVDWNEILLLVSKALVREALDRRSLDNVTVLIVKLTPQSAKDLLATPSEATNANATPAAAVASPSPAATQ